MVRSDCFCGFVIEGSDMDAAVASGVAHWGEVHPEYGLTETSIRNYLEGEQRINGPTERLDEIGEIEIRDISVDTRADIVDFFDYRAFADNTAWGMCYCMFHHIGGRYAGEWPHRTWQENRSDLADRIDQGKTTGVVAYVDGELAGFCNATARSAFPARTGDDDEGVGSIVCFVVAPPYRGHGVSRAMLTAALERLRELGMSVAEAYPIVDPETGASAFVGTLSLYENAGFDVFSEDPLVVRKQLA